MMKVLLTNDTLVRMAKGTVVEVSDEEAKRLKAFKNAVDAPKTKKGSGTKA